MDVLGRGGMGVVYRAHDAELDRVVAVKLLASEDPPEELRARLQREARSMAKLSHSGVVQVYEAGLHGGQVFLAIEFVDGGTLADWMKSDSRDWREVVTMLCLAGEGLAAANQAGIIHRDFKPANVLITSEGYPKVTDFGVSRVGTRSGETSPSGQASNTTPANRDVGLTSTGAVLGTPAYMSPEQMDGRQLDATSDQFSFCVVLFEALTGSRPFPGATLSQIRERIGDGTPPQWPKDSSCPAPLRAAIERGLRLEPGSRWPDLTSLLAELRRVVDLRARRRRWMMGGGGLALAVSVTAYLTGGPPAVDCEGLQSASELVSAPRLAKVRDIWSTPELDYGAKSVETALTTVAGLAEDLDLEEQLSCRATHHDGSQSPARMDERADCFSRQRDLMTSFLELLEGGDPKMGLRAADVAASLEREGACSAAGDGLSLLPSDPEQRAAVMKLRVRLQATRSKMWSGDWSAAEASLASVEGPVQGLAFPGLEIEFQLLRGEYLAARERGEEAVLAFEAAADLAEANGFDRIAVRAWFELAKLAATTLYDAKRAESWGRRAHSAAARGGLSAQFKRQFQEIAAGVAELEGRYDDAQEIAQEILSELEASEASDLMLAEAGFRVGTIHYSAGQMRESASAFVRAHEWRSRALGANHPITLGIREARLAPLMASGEYEEAAREITSLREILGANPSWGQELLVRLDLDALAYAMNNGDAEAALKEATAGIERAEGVEGLDRGVLIGLRSGRGTISFALGDYASAVEDYRWVLAAEREWPGADQAEMLARGNLAEALMEDGKLAQALAEFEHVEQELLRFPETAGDEAGVLLRAHGKTLALAGDVDDARVKLEAAVRAFESSEDVADEVEATRALLDGLPAQ
jgi:tetratricopeptide (TPR) repeat protein/predicted Ser/Thr protein kinase